MGLPLYLNLASHAGCLVNFILFQTGNRVARCRCGQLYGGSEKLKVLLALLPSALHLDFFAAAKPSLLGTARGKVTLLLSLDRRKLEEPAILLDGIAGQFMEV